MLRFSKHKIIQKCMHTFNFIELHICYCSTYLHCYELHVGSILITAMLRFPTYAFLAQKLKGNICLGFYP